MVLRTGFESFRSEQFESHQSFWYTRSNYSNLNALRLLVTNSALMSVSESVSSSCSGLRHVSIWSIGYRAQSCATAGTLVPQPQSLIFGDTRYLPFVSMKNYCRGSGTVIGTPVPPPSFQCRMRIAKIVQGVSTDRVDEPFTDITLLMVWKR